jgi:hypothetical protein
MRLFVTIFFAVVSVSTAQHQQEVDPAYLRQYYAQIAQQSGAEQRATPIYEQQEQPQYHQQAAPLRNFPKAVVQQQQAYAPQPQHQPRQYQPEQQIQYQQPKAAPRPKKPAFVQQPEEESPEDYDPNPSYQFGFDVKDDEFTNYQNRKESREGNVIKGSYSVVDSDGFIRTVSYTADPKEGFKAEVVREPTDIVIKTSPPQNAAQLQAHQQAQYRPAAPAAKQAQPQYVQSQPQYRGQQQQQQQQRPDYAQYEQ